MSRHLTTLFITLALPATLISASVQAAIPKPAPVPLIGTGSTAMGLMYGDLHGDSWIRPIQVAANSGTVPAGKYACYTFDAGQLNYTYTDVLIRNTIDYAVGEKQGTYTVAADGALHFTGTLANAKGRFSIKNGGKAQIDLIFNGDSRSSMACALRNL